MSGALEDLCRILDFDSEFFGLRIGRMLHDAPGNEEFQRALSWCRDRAVRCLYFLCPSTAIETAQ